ncbi:hypothetical protein ANN_06338 [Periplaneta americana]|uniref:DUF4817 domain-containing protein n=1 Tax=Periplaneta americana TaxID=6978 RepID=A0ABQ8TF19_PERAM|nr:hypothetical protein ANN_06338 [Periplaneta americana]
MHLMGKSLMHDVRSFWRLEVSKDKPEVLVDVFQKRRWKKFERDIREARVNQFAKHPDSSTFSCKISRERARARNDYRKPMVVLLSVLTYVWRHAEGGEERADEMFDSHSYRSAPADEVQRNIPELLQRSVMSNPGHLVTRNECTSVPVVGHCVYCHTYCDTVHEGNTSQSCHGMKEKFHNLERDSNLRLPVLRSLPSKETLRGHSDSSFRGEGYIQCCVGVRLCDMYSNQELAEIHFIYGKADGNNAALARRLYQERYPQRQCPDRKTFVRLHYRLCEYGKFNSPGLGRRRDDQDLQLQKYRRRFWRL